MNRTQDETDAELEYETKRPRRIEKANQGAGQSRIPVSGSTAELESRLDAVKLLKEVEIGLLSVLFTSKLGRVENSRWEYLLGGSAE